jgi:hypothetical protein
MHLQTIATTVALFVASVLAQLDPIPTNCPQNQFVPRLERVGDRLHCQWWVCVGGNEARMVRDCGLDTICARGSPTTCIKDGQPF